MTTKPTTAQVDISVEAVEQMAHSFDMAGLTESAQRVRALRLQLTASASRIALLEELLRTEPAQAHTTMWQRERRAALAKGETK